MQLEEDVEDAFDDRVQLNHVLRQHPAAGSFLKRDRKVRVVLSQGARDMFVPRVVGERVAEAQLTDATDAVGWDE